MKKRWFVIPLVLFLLVVAVLIYISVADAPKPVTLNVGWNKLDTVDGIVPKGSILVTSVDSNLIIPGDNITKKKTGFISSGVVIVFDDTNFVSEGPIWVYVSEDYEFITKMDDFSSQLKQKMIDLSGSETGFNNFYKAGKPR